MGRTLLRHPMGDAVEARTLEDIGKLPTVRPSDRRSPPAKPVNRGWPGHCRARRLPMTVAASAATTKLTGTQKAASGDVRPVEAAGKAGGIGHQAGERGAQREAGLLHGGDRRGGEIRLARRARRS